MADRTDIEDERLTRALTLANEVADRGNSQFAEAILREHAYCVAARRGESDPYASVRALDEAHAREVRTKLSKEHG